MKRKETKQQVEITETAPPGKPLLVKEPLHLGYQSRVIESDLRKPPASSELMVLAQKVRERRKNLKMTQEELSLLAETGVVFVIRLEGGQPGLGIEKILAVLRVLGLRMDIVDRRS